MHFASFDLDDPAFDAHGFTLSLQVVTRENVYGIDPAKTSARMEDGVFVVRAAGLRAAGGQVAAPGAAIVRVTPGKPGQVRVQAKAKAAEPVRCVKLLVRGLGAPLRLVEESGERAVGPADSIAAAICSFSPRRRTSLFSPDIDAT